MNQPFKSLNLLPEVFRTQTNEQFLSATLDVLTAQPQFNRVEGFIGDKSGYAVEANDRYVVEPSSTRANYQLSPSVVFLKENTQTAKDFIDYPGIINALKNQGASVSDPNKLFSSEFYSWDSFCDLDKIVNFSQYYWLPLGPDSVAVTSATPVDINTIIGAKTWTSENGVEFINGLKVKFNALTTPAEYSGQEYYVEGVGTAINLLLVSDLRSVENVGEGIYDPWSSTPWSSGGWSVSLYVPISVDYIVINRNSRDQNAWSRGNRWFSQAVIDATTRYNGSVTINEYNTITRAARPIIEFVGNLVLWNSGRIGAGIVDFIDNDTLDPVGTIPGQTDCTISYTTGTTPADTVTVRDGATVVFSGASDIAVRRQIYRVNYVPAGVTGANVVTLTPLPGSTITDCSQIYIASGPGDQAGKGWRWCDIAGEWMASQQKAMVNQPPKFNIFDTNGISIGDKSFYGADTTFEGTTLFQYADALGANDPVLGFPISYSSITNLGDINFEVSLNSDVFTRTLPSGQVTQSINDYFVHYYPTQDTLVQRNGWVKAAGESFQYQVFVSTLESGDNAIFCDIATSETTPWTPVQVFLQGNFIGSDQYAVIVDRVANTTTILLNNTPTETSAVSVMLISDSVSPTAYYSIPSNLQNNPFNASVTTIAVGDIRNHYKTIFQNAPGVTGSEFGVNNYGNLGDLTPYGTSIVQNSASLVLPSVFIRRPGYSVSDALRFAGDEYIDYKNTIVDIAQREDYSVYQTPASILDNIIYKITAAKSSEEPFFWTDMIPSGSPYATNTYSFDAAVPVAYCSLGTVYDFKTANYYGVLVYHTRVVAGRKITTQLTRGLHYAVSEDTPGLRVDYDIIAGDKITVTEYNQTYGSYVPSTPTSLGMYPSSIPRIETDDTYSIPVKFIVGHDGSRTRLYGEHLLIDDTNPSLGSYLTDFRDIAIFEFECRVYNNLKVQTVPAITYADLFPGRFRTTKFSRKEMMPAYSESFLTWVGKNKIDYRSQTFSLADKFTYNYNRTTDRLSGETIDRGYWRGVYLWYYDTVNPHTAPWEMLGLSDKPSWWQSRYGVAPYTSGNTILWNDIESGIIWNDGAPYTDTRYARPNIMSMLPVDAAGNLRSPFDSVVGNYESSSFNRSWVVGDIGPAEASYLRTSTWPFDLIKLMSVFMPAKFYNFFADIDLYKFNESVGQYLVENAGHLNPSELTIYGSGQAKHSYMNWVVDALRRSGSNGHREVATTLSSVDVRLTYKLAGFSDKRYLKFLIERSTPTSNTPRLLIPDDSYQIMLYDSVPEVTINYSSVIIQKTLNGYTVWGNSATRPYFEIATPTDGPKERITVDQVSVDVSTTYRKNSSVIVAYGTEFYSIQGVCEFIRNYGRDLADRGVESVRLVDGNVIDWTKMIKEFVNWAQLGWEIGTTISINPNATSLSVSRPGLVVQPLSLGDNNFALNQNLIPLTPQSMSVVRTNEQFNMAIISVGDAIAYTNLNMSSIEHAVVFDNTTIFNDVIYQLATGLRQNRITLTGKKTAGWNGSVDAHGFILSENDITEWTINGKYPKGQIVLYKELYWAAQTLVEQSSEFDYSKWKQVDYDSVKQGLLPNPSTSAYESTKFYDITDANLERDNDLLAFGLIGFRPRQYLVDAELSDISQVNVYNNMIRGKGTVTSAEAFKGARLVQGQIDYDISENWAIKSGDFGAVLGSNFVEFMLDETSLTGNPTLIGFTQDGAINTSVQQSVDITNIINYARAPSTSRFLPPYTGGRSDIRKLPTAGYVNLNDVKMSAYSFDDLNLVSENISTLYTTDSVWIANYRGSWTVMSPVSLGTTVVTASNNQNGTIRLTFADQHGLSADDPIAIVGFNDAVDGFFEVLSVDSLVSITVTKDIDRSVSVITGVGIAMLMIERRVRQASDAVTIASNRFQTRLNWVDSDVDGDWQVMSAGPVYVDRDAAAIVRATSIAYSSSLGTLSVDNAGILSVDSVSTGVVIGNVIATSRNFVYGVDSAAINIVDLGDVTAPIVTTISHVGAMNITVSRDGKWMYVVDAVGVSTYMEGITPGQYSLSDDSLVGPVGEEWGSSIATTYDGSRLVVGAPGRTVDGLVNAGAAYIYSRASESFMSDGTTASVTVVDPIQNNIAIVEVNGVIVPATISGSSVTLTTTAPAGSIITVHYGKLSLQRYLESEMPQTGGLFGHSVTTRLYGAEIFIGAPYDYDRDNGVEGAVYRYTNSGQRYGTVIAKPILPTTVDATIFIDTFKIVIPAGTATTSAIANLINIGEPTNIVAIAQGDRVYISTAPNTSVTQGDIVDIVGYSVTDLETLGIVSYDKTQVIHSPDGDTDTAFGWKVLLNSEISNRDSLVISAPTASAFSATTFDFTDNLITDDDTIFDNGATSFIDAFAKVGSVYQYDYLQSDSETADNPGKYVFGQYCQYLDFSGVSSMPKWGDVIAFSDNTIVVGSSDWFADGNGITVKFTAVTATSSWRVTAERIDTVDVSRLKNVSIYDVRTNTTIDHLDIVDPLQGKMLSAVETNLDFISSDDPARYDSGLVWGDNQVGWTWLDTNQLRMMDYSQPDVNYNARNWGKAFPGSLADIYTWVSSGAAPIDYIGPGFPVEYNKFVVLSSLNASSDSIVNTYYFWVKNYSAVPIGKTLSPLTVARYIIDPASSGIAFISAISTDTIAMYNCGDAISDSTSALHIGYSQGYNDDNAHQDWTLIQEGSADQFLSGLPRTISEPPSSLYLKYLNSFMGADIGGRPVPDQSLPDLVKHGISFRPRQTMFIDREEALLNFIQRANARLAEFAITETRGTTFLMKKGVSYDTTDYWSEVDWWAAGYDATTKVILEVPTYTDLLTIGQRQLYTGNDGLFLSLESGLIARVAKNGQGLSETYIWNASTGWTRIGLQRGTIRIDSAIATKSDPIPYMEIYYIIRWLTEQVYINELQVENNASLIAMFELIQTQSLGQNNYLNWLNKTSLIDVTHRVRPLAAYKKYQRDNQELVREYIEEIKPYHVYIKEFSLRYDSMDTFESSVSDFDLPPKYDFVKGRFTSPILAYQNASSIDGEYPPSSEIWSEPEYSEWWNNYGLTISNDEYATVEVTRLVVLNITLSLFADTAAGSTVIRVVTVDGIQSSGTLMLNGETHQYTQVNYVTNRITLANPTAYLHRAGTIVSVLTDTLSNNALVINLKNTDGLPDSGTIIIGSEQLSYSINDRGTDTLRGVVRGINGTAGMPHVDGETVSLITLPVTVITGGRGYTTAPVVTAWIDTAIYPTPRTPAQLVATITNGQVTGITVLEPGSGYAVTPEIRIGASPILESWTMSQVDAVRDQINTVAHAFVTGDTVKFTGTPNRGLSESAFYYVGVIDTDNIALYTDRRDAELSFTNDFRHDTKRVRLIDGLEGSLAISARAEIYTHSRPVREIGITVKFDRTSYKYDESDENAIYRIQKYYNPSATMPGFDLNDYDQLMTGTQYPGMILLDPSFGYGKTLAFTVAPVFPNTITDFTVQILRGPDDAVSSDPSDVLVAGEVYRVVYIASTATASSTFALSSGVTYYLRATTSGSTPMVSVYLTENNALSNTNKIPLTEGAGQFVLISDEIGQRMGYDAIVTTNRQRITAAPPVVTIIDANIAGYPAPVYDLSSYDPAKLTVTINGVAINPDISLWTTDYEPPPRAPSRFDAEFNKLFGYFDNGTPFDNWTGLSVILTPAYLATVVGQLLVITYDFDVTSPVLPWSGATPYNYIGGDFSDGFGPEELVPGTVSAMFNMTVREKPGSTWDPRAAMIGATSTTEYAHTGFSTIRTTLNPVGGVVSFAGLAPNPASISLYANGKLYDATSPDGSQRHLSPAYYTVDWVNQTITLVDGPLITNGSLTTTPIDVVVHEWGNGNQIVRSNSTVMPLRSVGSVSEIYLDVPYRDIELPDATNWNLTAGVTVNGQHLVYGTDYTIQRVRPDLNDDTFNPAKLVFTKLYDAMTDYVSFVVTGNATAENGSVIVPAVGVGIPRTQWITGMAGAGDTVDLLNFLGDDNVDNMIVEVNGQRVASTAPVQATFTVDPSVLSYPAPVYSLPTFDPSKLTVLVNGAPIAPGVTRWVTDYDPLTLSPARFDADFNKLFGYFDDGTPFDNWSALDVVFDPAFLATIIGQQLAITYDVTGQTSDAFSVTVNPGGIGGVLTLNKTVAPTDTVSVTTFDRTTDLSMMTQTIADVTVTRVIGVVEDGVNPVSVTTSADHNLSTGDRITINGDAAEDLDGGKYYVNVTSPTSFTLWSDAAITTPLVLDNPGPFVPLKSSFVQVIDASQILPSPFMSQNPLEINQPDYTLDDPNRLWVSLIRDANFDVTGYISPSKLMVVDNTLIILREVVPTDLIVITSTVPSASPDEVQFRLSGTTSQGKLINLVDLPIVTGAVSNQTGAPIVDYVELSGLSTEQISGMSVFADGNLVSGFMLAQLPGTVARSTAVVLPSTVTATTVDVRFTINPTPSVYRENQYTRTYLTSVLPDALGVADPTRLVQISRVTGITVLPADITNGIVLPHCIVPVTSAQSTTSITTSVTDFTQVVVSSTEIMLLFTATPVGTVLDFTVATGNTVIIQSEQIMFRSIDLVNKTISGLSRGTAGTIVNSVLDVYSPVQSVQPIDQLTTAFYSIDWYQEYSGLDIGFPKVTTPLQFARSTVADFLNAVAAR